jgi:hypothetical protein
MSVKTYVYEGKEVVMTGRTASKTLRSGKISIIYEIRPANVPADQTMYNQWVAKDEVFEVDAVPL